LFGIFEFGSLVIIWTRPGATHWGNASFVSAIQFEGISTVSLNSVWARDLIFGAWNFHNYTARNND
jgi:hypothetical protein